MEPDLKNLKETYSKLSDNKLLKIASDEAATLRPEALEILKKELEQRSLTNDIQKGIEAQLNEVSEEELITYCEIIRKVPCPICQSKDKKLNATMTATSISLIVLTLYTKSLKIACPDCLDNENNKAWNRSGLFGWYGIPFGIIRTIQAYNFNRRMKKQNHDSNANELLKTFVLQNIGRIEANRNNEIELQALLKRANNK